MKTFISILVLVVLGAGLWFWGEKNNMGNSTVTLQVPGESGEFCYVKFQDSADSGFQDKYTLRMKLEGEKAEGEIRLLPAEKDALIGKFAGIVSTAEGASEKIANLIWDTEGEGMTAKQEMRIIMKGTTATLGFGEMALREDGVYVYADPAKVDYSFTMDKISCSELNEREAVEKYLWENIATLSPIAPALGGNWYVVAATLDLEKNTGAVTYEDGHIQEKRDFSYVLGASGAVESLTIQ